MILKEPKTTQGGNVEQLPDRASVLRSAWRRVYELKDPYGLNVFDFFEFDRHTEAMISKHPKRDSFYKDTSRSKEDRLRRLQIFRFAVFAGRLSVSGTQESAEQAKDDPLGLEDAG